MYILASKREVDIKPSVFEAPDDDTAVSRVKMVAQSLKSTVRLFRVDEEDQKPKEIAVQ